MPSTGFEYAIAIQAARGAGQDRAAVFEHVDRLVVALADGAGGTSNGARAAQAIVDAVGAVEDPRQDWCALLEALDGDHQRLRNGQSTAVVLSLDPGGIRGASVGDSGAWVIRGDELIDLTEGQLRKPLLGDGCRPFRVRGLLGGATLLAASDGLWRYARRGDIVRLAQSADLEEAARALVALVRLANGALQDDVAVVLCRSRGQR